MLQWIMVNHSDSWLFISLYIFRSRIAMSDGNSNIHFFRNCYNIFHSGHNDFYIVISNAWGFLISHILASTCYFVLSVTIVIVMSMIICLFYHPFICSLCLLKIFCPLYCILVFVIDFRFSYIAWTLILSQIICFASEWFECSFFFSGVIWWITILILMKPQPVNSSEWEERKWNWGNIWRNTG